MNLESRPEGLLFKPAELPSDVDEQTLRRLVVQVSETIEQDREEHPGVMLPQNPEELLAQFRAGRSSVIMDRGNPEFKLIAHGTIWSLCEVGGISLQEIGSVIVLPEYRGRKISELIVRSLLERCGPDTLLIATTKDIRMVRALRRHGLMPVYYEQYPAVCQATCVCNSLREGRCGFRRLPQQNSEEVLKRVFASGERVLDTITECTLFISDLELAEEFERKVREG